MRNLSRQILEHASPDRLRLRLEAQALALRVHADAHLPQGYRRILELYLDICSSTFEKSNDLGEWRAATECWNCLASQVNKKFPVDPPLPSLEPPHPR